MVLKAPILSGRSSGVEHNLAKVGVVSSNLIARSKSSFLYDPLALQKLGCSFCVDTQSTSVLLKTGLNPAFRIFLAMEIWVERQVSYGIGRCDTNDVCEFTFEHPTLQRSVSVLACQKRACVFGC